MRGIPALILIVYAARMVQDHAQRLDRSEPREKREKKDVSSGREEKKQWGEDSHGSPFFLHVFCALCFSVAVG